MPPSMAAPGFASLFPALYLPRPHLHQAPTFRPSSQIPIPVPGPPRSVFGVFPAPPRAPDPRSPKSKNLAPPRDPAGPKDRGLMKVEASDGDAAAAAASKRRRGKRMAAEGGGGGMRAQRRGRRVLPPSDAIQRLYLACKSVFKGPGTVPDPAGVEMLKLLLDGMKPDDVGLSMDIPFFKSKPRSEGTPRITCAKIKECENFSMCIFFLPPSAVIPLHNHPGMTVFNKLLLGLMHIKSYDWLDPVPSNIHIPSANLRPAKLVVDSDITAPCDTLILYPEKAGNIHTLTAITPCVVLDVLGPPYSAKDDRDITYYRDYPFIDYADDSSDQSGGRDQRIGWLEEIELSEDSKMAMVPYMGPPVTSG